VAYWFTPIASRARMVNDGEALAEVWYVGVLRSQVVPAVQTWRTATYRLVWEEGDWRVSEESETVGPVPTLASSGAPTSAAEMNALVEGFESRELAP
jgi:hypothetical protein